MPSFRSLRAQLSHPHRWWPFARGPQHPVADPGPADRHAGGDDIPYRHIVETQPELICQFRADGRVEYANPAYCRYFGCDRADIIGQPYQAVIHQPDVPAVVKQVQALGRENCDAVIEARVMVQGALRWTRWHSSCTCDEAGTIVAYQWVGRDISDQRAVEAALQDSEHRYQALQQTLEQRVAERVADLAAANQALVHEIQERRQAEAALKDSEERFRRAIAEAPYPIIIHGEDGRILQMSHVISEITGYGEGQLQTLEDWVERAYRERRHHVLKQINDLYATDQRINEGEFAITTQDGTVRTWLFSSSPLGRLADGTKLVISMAADVTEQKRAEQALAIRLKQQAVVTQLSQNALKQLQLQNLFTQATRLVASSLGVDYAKVLKLLPDGQHLKLEAGFGWQPGQVGQATVVANTNSQAGFTLLCQQPVVVENLATETRFHGPPLLTDHGVVSGISTIIQGVDSQPFGILGAHATRPQTFSQNDIDFLQAVANLLAAAIHRKHTELQLQQLNQHLEDRVQQRTQALEEVNHELEAFSYSVAHDLRAPLRAIQGFAQVIVEDYEDALDDLGKDYIHRVAASAEHLDALVQDLLTYSRLGRDEIRLQPVNLDRLIGNVLDDLQVAIVDSAAHINVAPNLPMVRAQRSVLKQVLTNLIDNAIKFVAPGERPRCAFGDR
jgi:PAS domain S-box-containing protein